MTDFISTIVHKFIIQASSLKIKKNDDNYMINFRKSSSNFTLTVNKN